MSKIHAVVAAVAGVLLLAGCTPAAPEAETTAEQSSPQKTEQAEAPAADDYAQPDACKILMLTPGVSMDGPSVAQCLAVSLSTYGSGKASIESDVLSGDVSFTYGGDGYSYAGTVDTEDGTAEITYADGGTWVDRGDGAERLDFGAASPDPIVAIETQRWEAIASPSVTAALVNAGEFWQVGQAKDITLGDGSTVNAFPVSNAGPITASKLTGQDLTVWFTERAVPVAIEGNLTFFGTTTDFRTTFYDLGSPVTIDPVG